MKTARDYEDPYDSEPQGPGPSFRLPTLHSTTRALVWVIGVLGVLCLTVGDLSLVRPVYELLALDPERWRSWFPFVPVWQLLTYGLLHATGDPFHLLINVLVLYQFGSLFEGVVGPRRMAAWMALSVAAGGVAQLAYLLISGSNAPTVGFSGAVMFLLVAMATLQPNMPVYFFIVRLRLVTLAMILIALDLYRVVMALKGQGGNVAFAVHLTGAALAFFAVRRHWIWIDPAASWRARVEARQESSRANDEQRLDELLQRIHRDGIGSLTGRERDFLRRMSSRRGGDRL